MLPDVLQGKYEILHEIGQGGMAVVYKGVDTALDREVAVKVLHPHLANRADSQMRLEREAKAVAKLKHPNILEIYDYSGNDCEHRYIVTEYIRGETLKDFTDRHTPSLPEVGAMIVHDVVRAVAHAHEHGIIHRDIKPENIMIRDDGVLKLMDFGIAQIIDMQQMTVTGALVGSPAHMSPEHVEGKPLDYRADIFSLGTMLYFLCTGRLPFESPSPHALLRQILEARCDDPRMHNPAIGRTLARIIMQCLEKDPDDRYQDTAELADALMGYLSSLGLNEPADELSLYFEDPATVEADLTRRVVEQLMNLANAQAHSGRVASALEAYNQVLALEGDRADALAQVTRLSNSRNRAVLLRRAAMAAVVAVTLGAGVWAVVSAQPPEAPGPLLATHAAAVPLAAPRALPLKAAKADQAASAGVAPAPIEAAPIPLVTSLAAAPLLPRVVREAEAGAPARGRSPVDLYGSAPKPAHVAKAADARRNKDLRKKVQPSGPGPKMPGKGLMSFKIFSAYNSTIKFDGVPYSKGYTETITRPAGVYTVHLSKPDCDVCVPKTYKLRLDAASPPPKRLTYRVGFKPATLVVKSTKGATVMVAGRRTTSGNPVELKMSRPNASVHVRVAADGYEPTRRLVKMSAGETTSLTIPLTQLDRP